MAPKASRSKNPSVLPGCGLSLEERRALRDSSAATISNGPLAAAAGASLLIPSTAVRGSLDDPLDLQGIGPARQSQPSPRVAGA